ncbi:MAG: hypothetical protein KC636_07425 [Myxococcales bacterium]|nr:hypothetical protein [Myxococcales bacterium]
MELREVSVSLPFGLGSLTLTVSDAERRAAWALYVELMTRVAIQPFDPEHGSLRAALSSLHRVFVLTREILRESGPEVARGPRSFGPLALRVCAEGLAPFLTRWHAALGEHEALRDEARSEGAHERAWELRGELLAELIELQAEMRSFARALAKISGAELE